MSLKNRGGGIDSRIVRYRDFGTLKYLLRSIDKFAPWVRNVYLVTCDQKPEWLNISHPKLKLVSQNSFIPSEYSPTFNSNAIELNFHRIEGLSENFVYFNDDMLLTAPTCPEDFFKNDMPCECFGLNLTSPIEMTYSFTLFNCFYLLNKHFNIKKQLRLHHRKCFSLKNGIKSVLKTLLLVRLRKINGLRYDHMPFPLKKSAYNVVWEKEGDWCAETSSHKLRSKDDMTWWVMGFWPILDGKFNPRSANFGHYYTMHDFVTNKKTVKILKSHKYKCICVNDNDVVDFESEKKEFESRIAMILGEKSSFEI